MLMQRKKGDMGDKTPISDLNMLVISDRVLGCPGYLDIPGVCS